MNQRPYIRETIEAVSTKPVILIWAPLIPATISQKLLLSITIVHDMCNSFNICDVLISCESNIFDHKMVISNVQQIA